jgi:hypothetical protein
MKQRYTEPLTPAEDADLESPSQDHTLRYLADQDIRAIRFGDRQKYEIADRPRTGPDLWRLAGTQLKFTKADVLLREKLTKEG